MEMLVFTLLTDYGLGSAKEMNTALAMSYLDGTLLTAMTANSSTTTGLHPYVTSFADLWHKIAATADIKYQANITKVDRPTTTGTQSEEGGESPMTIHYKVLGSEEEEEQQHQCKSLIVAFPQTIENLEAFDLDQSEEEVFNQVYTDTVYTSLVNLPQGSPGGFMNIFQRGPPPSSTSMVSNFYHCDDDDLS